MEDNMIVELIQILSYSTIFPTFGLFGNAFLVYVEKKFSSPFSVEAKEQFNSCFFEILCILHYQNWND